MTPRPSIVSFRLRHAAAAFLVAACAGPAQAAGDAGATATLVVLATTDLHANLRSYDYFKLAEDRSYGFERTATLVRQAREEFPNTLLVDNGDTLQGTALADYEAMVRPVPCDRQLSVFQAMGVLGFDAGTLGNHEFNYGLPFLNRALGGGLEVDGVDAADAARACAGAGYPVVLANVRSRRTGRPLVPPYVILERTVSPAGSDGRPVALPIRIGVIGFAPPGIMQWDRRHLEGRVSAEGAVEAATKYLPEMRARGADVVVALLHGGLDAHPYAPTMENPGLHLARVPGIDAMVLGHQHGVFPGTAAAPAYRQPGVDHAAGTVHGVPAAMPSSWGKALGVIRLALVHDGAAWAVDRSRSRGELRTIGHRDAAGRTAQVEADPAIAARIEPAHQAAIGHMKMPIGETDFRMSTVFADVGDPGAIQIVNQAQQAYVAAYVRDRLPQYAQLPVLSVSAPFKSGFQGAADYTDVAAGPLAIFNAADLYPYPNTVHAVKVDGAGIKRWLEGAARRFNRIDPARTGEQALVGAFPGYGFDMFTSPEVQYEIDVTRPVGSRIRNLTHRGRPIDAAQEFVIATNNYRATSGKSYADGLDGSATVWASTATSREVVIDYIRRHPSVTRAANGAARSWRFARVETAGPVVFSARADSLPMARAAGLGHITLLAPDDGSGRGLARYRIDLSQ